MKSEANDRRLRQPYNLPKVYSGVIADKIHAASGSLGNFMSFTCENLDELVNSFEDSLSKYIDKMAARAAFVSSRSANRKTALCCCLEEMVAIRDAQVRMTSSDRIPMDDFPRSSANKSQKGDARSAEGGGLSLENCKALIFKLVDLGADVPNAIPANSPELGGVVAMAVRTRDIDVVKTIVEASCVGLKEINARIVGSMLSTGNRRPPSPLEEACRLGLDDIAIYLLDLGASVEDFCFSYAGGLRSVATLTRILTLKEASEFASKSCGVAVTPVFGNKKTPFVGKSTGKKTVGAIVGVAALRDPNVDIRRSVVNEECSEGLTALLRACFMGNQAVVDYLLDHPSIEVKTVSKPLVVSLGTQVAKRDQETKLSKLPLYHAIRGGSVSIIELLSRRGLLTAEELNTPLHKYGNASNTLMHTLASCFSFPSPLAVPQLKEERCALVRRGYRFRDSDLCYVPDLSQKEIRDVEEKESTALRAMLEVLINAGGDINCMGSNRCAAPPIFYAATPTIAKVFVSHPLCDVNVKHRTLDLSVLDFWLTHAETESTLRSRSTSHCHRALIECVKAVLSKLSDLSCFYQMIPGRELTLAGGKRQVLASCSLMYALVFGLPPRPSCCALPVDEGDASEKIDDSQNQRVGVLSDDYDALLQTNHEFRLRESCVKLLLEAGVSPSLSLGPSLQVGNEERVYLQYSDLSDSSDCSSVESFDDSYPNAAISAFQLATSYLRSFQTRKASRSLTCATWLDVNEPIVNLMLVLGNAAKEEPDNYFRYLIQSSIISRDYQQLLALLLQHKSSLTNLVPVRISCKSDNRNFHADTACKKLGKNISRQCAGLSTRKIRIVDDALLFAVELGVAASKFRAARNLRQSFAWRDAPKFENENVCLIRALLEVGGADPNSAAYYDPLIAIILRSRKTVSKPTLQLLIDVGGLDTNAGLASTNCGNEDNKRIAMARDKARKKLETDMRKRGRGKRHKHVPADACCCESLIDDDEGLLNDEDSDVNDVCPNYSDSVCGTRNKNRYINKALLLMRPDVALMLWRAGCRNQGYECEIFQTINMVSTRWERKIQIARRRTEWVSKTSSQRAESDSWTLSFTSSERNIQRHFLKLAHDVSEYIGQLECERRQSVLLKALLRATSEGFPEEDAFRNLCSSEEKRRQIVAEAFAYTRVDENQPCALRFPIDDPFFEVNETEIVGIYSRRLKLQIQITDDGHESPALNTLMISHGADLNTGQHVMCGGSGDRMNFHPAYGPTEAADSLLHLLSAMESNSLYSRRNRYFTIRAALDAGADVGAISACCESVGETQPRCSKCGGARENGGVKTSNPLAIAVRSGWADLAWLLLENGANKAAKDCEGRRPIDYFKKTTPICVAGNIDEGMCDLLRLSLEPAREASEEDKLSIESLRRRREERIARTASRFVIASFVNKTTIPETGTDHEITTALSSGTYNLPVSALNVENGSEDLSLQDVDDSFADADDTDNDDSLLGSVVDGEPNLSGYSSDSAYDHYSENSDFDHFCDSNYDSFADYDSDNDYDDYDEEI